MKSNFVFYIIAKNRKIKSMKLNCFVLFLNLYLFSKSKFYAILLIYLINII